MAPIWCVCGGGGSGGGRAERRSTPPMHCKSAKFKPRAPTQAHMAPAASWGLKAGQTKLVCSARIRKSSCPGLAPRPTPSALKRVASRSAPSRVASPTPVPGRGALRKSSCTARCSAVCVFVCQGIKFRQCLCADGACAYVCVSVRVCRCVCVRASRRTDARTRTDTNSRCAAQKHRLHLQPQ